MLHIIVKKRSELQWFFMIAVTYVADEVAHLKEKTESTSREVK